MDSPLTRKLLGAAPFIGDAVIFLMDLLSGKHWVRAILRTVGAFGVDAGFYALLGLTGIAAPFSAGSSLALSAALIGAYMAADAAAGAALGNDGIGQFLGDFVADKLGVPKKAGETGGGAWESLFGSGGKINSSQGSVDKLIEGVKLSEKEKEAISRVGGGLGDPNMKELKGEDKRRALEKLEYQKKRRDAIKAHGFGSDEVKALEDERFEQLTKNTYPTGNANNIVSTNGISNKVNNISSYSEEEETVIVKSGSETRGDVAPETQTKESLAPVVVGGGGGSREIDEAHYKGS